MAGIQRYFENELTDEWREGREAAIKVGRLRNHRSSTTERNDMKLPLWVALDFQEQGVMSPQEITEDEWLRLVERYRHGRTRGGRALAETSIKKRREGLIQILTGLHLGAILEFVTLWRPMKQEEVISWWRDEEMEAMNQTALRVFEEGVHPERAIAHLLHYTIGPRRSDSAFFRWDCIDLRERMIRFPASKNRKRCQNRIEERFIPVFERYHEILTEFEGGRTFIFPKSRAQKSGTDKAESSCVTGKTVANWLAWIRDQTVLPDGSPISPYPSHSYRHSLAMRYLNSGSRYEDISIVLGDTVATIERHYAELVFGPASERAFARAHPKSRKEKAVGTAQPEWMTRDVGFRTLRSHVSAVHRNGVLDAAEGGGRSWI